MPDHGVVFFGTEKTGSPNEPGDRRMPPPPPPPKMGGGTGTVMMGGAVLLTSHLQSP